MTNVINQRIILHIDIIYNINWITKYTVYYRDMTLIGGVSVSSPHSKCHPVRP